MYGHGRCDSLLPDAILYSTPRSLRPLLRFGILVVVLFTVRRRESTKRKEVPSGGAIEEGKKKNRLYGRRHRRLHLSHHHHKNHRKTPNVVLAPFYLENIPQFSGVAVLGSSIYVAGGFPDTFPNKPPPTGDLWSRLDHYLGPSSGSLGYGPSAKDHPVAAGGGTMYWFRYGLVHAYHLFRKRFYSVSIGGIHDYVRASLLTDSNDCHQLLVGIGGNKLCLVCITPHQSLLHCVEFRVDDEPCFHGNKASLNAVVEPSNAYCINRSQMILSAMFIQCSRLGNGVRITHRAINAPSTTKRIPDSVLGIRPRDSSGSPRNIAR
ncbi:hypothetical protein RHGRI_008782 [Rhododendron griersonianum]|uniref:Uncharacterized protein n=1 Tax=Rhododendron griersonianum TaxID=479676 RepID=A0AAV6L2Q5_9ERIC|nr:hypothetical protein RHGRI_008782 [Rhododendron griersonianum]